MWFINDNKYNCALYYKLHITIDSHKILLLIFLFSEPLYLLVIYGNNWWMSVVRTWVLTDICIYVNLKDSSEARQSGASLL